MQALILAGGQGTRLRPLTLNTPKPVVPLLNRPFLLFQIDNLRFAGITDIILSLNYQPGRIEELLGDGSKYGVNLTYLVEPEPMGTGGAFGYARDLITRPTVVLNGDILTNLQIAEMAAFHNKCNADATIYLTPVADPSAYGLVETESDMRVRRFLEKPKPELNKITTNNINAGIYILEPKVLDLIPEGQNTSFEYQVFPALLEKKHNFYAYVDENAYWRDIGNPRSYLKANNDFLSGRIEWFSEGTRESTAYISEDISIDGPSITGLNCVFGDGCQIIGSVIGDDVTVGEGTIIENSVIWPGTRIGRNVSVADSVVGNNCIIEDSVILSGSNILGDNTLLTAFTKI